MKIENLKEANKISKEINSLNEHKKALLDKIAGQDFRINADGYQGETIVYKSEFINMDQFHKDYFNQIDKKINELTKVFEKL